MRGFRMLVSALAVVGGLAMLAGCGDEDDNSAMAGGALTKAEFVKQANAICKKGNAGIQARAQEVLNSVGEKPLLVLSEEMVEEAVAPGFELEIRQIRALDAPPGDEREIEAILTEMEAVIDRMRKEPIEVQRVSYRSPYRTGMEMATDYGIGACARPYVQ